MSSSKVFNCPLCVKVFHDQTKLSAHTVSHTKEKPHKCPTCSAAFGRSGNLQQHIRTVHGGVKRIYKTKVKCSSCDYECGTQAKMKEHLRKHSAERPFTCSEPGCSFDTKYVTSLRQHVSVVHGNARSFKCPSEGCSYQSKYLGVLKVHLKTHSNERPFPCKFPGCKKTFKRKMDIKAHSYRVHSSEKPFKCSSCEFETKHKSRLRQHEDEHKNIKRFHCQFPNCNHASNYKAGVQRHYDAQHRKKNVFCTAPGCDFRCGSITLLKMHAKIHFLPILKCPKESCHFSTRSPRTLRIHFSCRHGDDESVSQMLAGRSRPMSAEPAVQPNQLVCPSPNCNYQTEFMHRYEKHTKTHDYEEKRKYSCKLCPMKFGAYSILEIHILSHTREKPYSCVHCEFTTGQSSQLVRHAEKYHGIYVNRSEFKTIMGTQKCKLCNKICMSQSDFVLHSMKHLQPVVVLERISININ